MERVKDYSLNLPDNYIELIKNEEYWSSENFAPIILTVEESNYKGGDIISHQLEFEVFDDEIDGERWQEILINSIQESYPELVNRIFGDSESESCVLWVKKRSEYEILFDATMKILSAMKRI